MTREPASPNDVLPENDDNEIPVIQDSGAEVLEQPLAAAWAAAEEAPAVAEESVTPVEEAAAVEALAPASVDDIPVVAGETAPPTAEVGAPTAKVPAQVSVVSEDHGEDIEPGAEAYARDEEEEVEVAPVSEEPAPGGLRRGQIIEGVIAQTSPTEILVDLPDGRQGIVSGRELSRMDRRALDDLEVGRPVLVYVLNPPKGSGKAVLSLTRAQEETDWRRAQEYVASQQLYNGKVSGYNKGGLIVRFGRVRGFVPASQVSEERRQHADGESPMERWGAMIGEDIVVKVVEVDHTRNRLILSERAAIKEWRDQRKADLLDQLEVGAVREGRVVSLTDFGAFVDLGGADGLVHMTELSWRHVTRPDEIVKVGDTVKVKVISLDRERRRIGLSMKSLEEDPWEVIVRKFKVGQLVRGTVTKLTKFGAFACLDEAPEIEGLIHISELADHRVGHPKEVVSEGEVLTLRIVKIDKAQRRMGLSLKQVDAIDYLEIDLATYDSNESAGSNASAGDPEAGQDPAAPEE